MDLPTPILLTGEHVVLGHRTRRAMEAEDIARTRWRVSRCPACNEGTHTSPPNGSTLCTCGVETCACIHPMRYKVP